MDATEVTDGNESESEEGERALHKRGSFVFISGEHFTLEIIAFAHNANREKRLQNELSNAVQFDLPLTCKLLIQSYQTPSS